MKLIIQGDDNSIIRPTDFICFSLYTDEPGFHYRIYKDYRTPATEARWALGKDLIKMGLAMMETGRIEDA